MNEQLASWYLWANATWSATFAVAAIVVAMLARKMLCARRSMGGDDRAVILVLGVIVAGGAIALGFAAIWHLTEAMRAPLAPMTVVDRRHR